MHINLVSDRALWKDGAGHGGEEWVGEQGSLILEHDEGKLHN